MQKHLLMCGVLLAIVFLSGCSDTTQGGKTMVKDGDTVKVDYWLTVDGEQIDTSEGRGPFSFVVGTGQVIPGFDKAVRGMAVGDTKEVTLTGEDAYTAGPLAGKTLNFKITLLAIN